MENALVPGREPAGVGRAVVAPGGRHPRPGGSVTASISKADAILARERRGIANLLHGSVTAYVVLGVSLLLTAAAWYFSNVYIEERTADRFRFRTAQVVDAVRARMLAYEQVLRGGVGLFDASREVSRDEWHNYVRTLQIEANYPGIQGMGVSVPIQASELRAHVEAVRREGFPDYSVRPDTPRETYHSIIYLEPFDWRNQRAFGFDMYSNPVRRAAMQRSIDSGLPTMSAMVTLVQETDQNVQKGFLFYLPVYRRGTHPTSVEQRRQAFAGHVYAAFRANDLMRGILGVGAPDVQLRIFDGSGTAEQQLLFDSSDEHDDLVAPGSSALRTVEQIDLAGHRWTLQVQSRPGFVSAGESMQSLVVACGGLSVDVLLFLIISAFGRQRSRALALAEAMTHDLRQSQERFRTVSDTAHDAILTTGPGGGILYCNASTTRIFGYPAEELLGRPLSVLVDAGRNPESALVLQCLLGGPRASDAGSVVEICARHRDGHDFPGEVSVARWHTAEGAFASLSLRDITQRKQMEAERTEYTAELERSNKELDNFAYVASHDLKAPLRAVDNLAEWIAKDTEGLLPDKSRVHLDRLRGRVRRMEGLLDDLLQYSRAGRVLGEETEVELCSLVDEVVALLAPAPGFTVRCESTVAPFRAYRTPLRQVLQNVVGNALKHHDRDHGEVLVSCERGNGWLHFVVRDDGPGIEERFRERVFGMFQTLRSRDEVEGSGMGLAIVRKIVESQGGRVDIAAAGVRGTKVRFNWPEAVAAAPELRRAAAGRA